MGYLAACLALALVLNTGTLTGALGSPPLTTRQLPPRKPPTTPAAPKNARQPDAAYEETICADNTMENYVRRLYYYVADTRDPAQSEVDFWVQALAGGRHPAVLGQSFIFTTDKANSYTDAQAFYTMASYALLGTDVTTGNADAYLPYFAEGGAMQAYKQLFNLPTCVERFAALGLDVGTMDDRIPLDRETVAAEVEAARATRATQSVTDAADEATYTPGYILHHLPATALLFVRSIVQKRRPLPAHAGRRQPKLLHAGSGLVLGGGALPAAGLRGAARPKRQAAYGQAAVLWRGGGRPELPAGRGRVPFVDTHPLRHAVRPAGAVLPARAARLAADLPAPPSGRRAGRSLCPSPPDRRAGGE